MLAGSCGIGLAAGPDAIAAATDSVAGAHAAAGDAAWEHGWLGRARERWLLAGEEADRERNPAVAKEIRARLEMLDAFERREGDAPADAGRSLPDVAGPLRIRWQAPLDADAIAPTIACGLVLWNTGPAVHALRLADGMPPWRAARGPADSLLFPRGVSLVSLGSRPSRPRPLAMAVTGGSLLAIIDGLAGADGPDATAGQMLACLDLSPAAEGRLAWLAAPPTLVDADAPPRPTLFDGPPVADHEITCAVVRSREPSDWLSLATFDSRDGRLLWTRPLGQATGRDGVDHAPAARSICFAEERIVAATHAGLVVAFERDGRPAWKTAVDAAGDGPPRSRAAPGSTAPVFCRGRILVAPRDRGGVVALDARSGRTLWGRSGLGTATIVGATPRQVIVGTSSDAGAAVVALALDDGGERARFPSAGTALSSAGNSLVVADHVLWPAAAKPQPAANPTLIHLLDAATLAEASAAKGVLQLEGFPPAARVNLAVGPGAIVLAVDRTLVCGENIPPAADPAARRPNQP